MTTPHKHHTASRLAENSADTPQTIQHSEAEARECDRRAEERTRPTQVELYVSPLMGTAALRFQDAQGHTHAPRDVISLPGTKHVSPVSDELTGAALAKVSSRGFRVVRGAYWQQNGSQAQLAIEPTRSYLDYVERRFGPLPEIPAIEGATVTPRTQRGWWDVRTADEEQYALTWSPQIGDDRWTVWGGPDYSRLVRSTTNQAKALFVLRHPEHARM
ncbi:hypothetical protein [Streptomyces lydicus]|uniref:hypothetical protein n=1 Tax=Streptomyces lydicus TaxID=47763 RepID=UPI0010129C58|nr:hypothetical protein [Streptomyces lydicus]MCZ1011974.1 hypothetical protein [Streptomyces lydicus]